MNSLNTRINNDYIQIAREFIENYIAICTLGYRYTFNYYMHDALCSLHVHSTPNSVLYEAVNQSNFANKLNDLGINILRFGAQQFIAQPVSTNGILITHHGFAEINNKNYQIISTILLNIACNHCLISNHCISIFM